MSRSYVLNYLHCVFATKQRKPTINDPASVWAYIRGIARNRQFDLLAIGGTNNHIHLLVALPPERRISDTMRDIKANSSRFIRTTNRLFAWQDGYAGVSVSPSQRPTVKKYTGNQVEHHRVRSFEDEYLSLLKRSGADFDPDDVLG